MPLPLPITPPPAWEVFVPRLDEVRPAGLTEGWPILVDGWTLPLALLQPLAPLLGQVEINKGENFLVGLQAENVLGTGVLPSTDRRRTPLAWIGLALREGGRLFSNLRSGCWVCGFPTVGRGKELLRAGNMADVSGLEGVLRELGQAGPPRTGLYFNFHYNQPEAACERVYVLDAVAGSLHGFAFPPSALAPANLK